MAASLSAGDDLTRVPYDDALERQIVAWCLRSPEAMTWTANNLAPEDFYREVHQVLFREMVVFLRDEPEGVNVSTLAVHLHGKTRCWGQERTDLLDYCGGIEYLSALVHQWASLTDLRGAQFVRSLGARLRDLARIRKLRTGALEVLDQIDREPGNVDSAAN